MVDYVVGALMILAPWLFGFSDTGIGAWIFVILGAGAILYSLLTDYELGVSRMIPMSTHLGLDIASGALLLVSPWLFGFADQVSAPHVVFGLFEIAAALTTQKVPSYRGSAAPAVISD
jgi:hypothetical protein